jgi:hypothetical protein
MKSPALKALSLLLAIGVLGALVAQASLVGCRSTGSEKAPATNADAPKGGAPVASSANGATATNATNTATATTNAAPTVVAPDPTYLPASKAGPILPPQQEPKK